MLRSEIYPVGHEQKSKYHFILLIEVQPIDQDIFVQHISINADQTHKININMGVQKNEKHRHYLPIFTNELGLQAHGTIFLDNTVAKKRA